MTSLRVTYTLCHIALLRITSLTPNAHIEWSPHTSILPRPTPRHGWITKRTRRRQAYVSNSAYMRSPTHMPLLQQTPPFVKPEPFEHSIPLPPTPSRTQRGANVDIKAEAPGSPKTTSNIDPGASPNPATVRACCLTLLQTSLYSSRSNSNLTPLRRSWICQTVSHHDRVSKNSLKRKISHTFRKVPLRKD